MAKLVNITLTMPKKNSKPTLWDGFCKPFMFDFAVGLLVGLPHQLGLTISGIYKPTHTHTTGGMHSVGMLGAKPSWVSDGVGGDLCWQVAERCVQID